MANVHYMYMYTLPKVPVVYKYKTEMVSGKAGFKSTMLGANYMYFGHTKSGVCATEAEAEENAACRLYKKLVGHN